MSEKFNDLIERIKNNPEELAVYKRGYEERVSEVRAILKDLEDFESLRQKFSEISLYLSDMTKSMLVGLIHSSLDSVVASDTRKIKRLRYELGEIETLL